MVVNTTIKEQTPIHLVDWHILPRECLVQYYYRVSETLYYITVSRQLAGQDPEDDFHPDDTFCYMFHEGLKGCRDTLPHGIHKLYTRDEILEFCMKHKKQSL